MTRFIVALALLSLPAVALTVNGTPPQGTVGVAYSYSFTASGGVAPYVFSAIGLPSGLTLSASGLLAGTPTAPAQNLPVSIVVTDNTGAKAAQVVLLQIGAVSASTPLTIVNSTLPNGSVGIPYSQTISATGGTLPYSGFTLVSGALPAGLSLVTGLISGTPTTSGTSSFSVQVSDLTGQTATKTLSLTISNFIITSGGPGVLDTSGIVYSPLISGAVGVGYSQPITASGGTPPYSFSVIGGALPPGFTLGGSGALTGTPSIASAYQFTVQAMDSASLITQKSFSLSIVPPGPLLTGVALASGTVGTGYSQSLTPTGGTPPYSFVIVSGSLPTGLSLSAGGVISGTPTVALLNAPFTVQITDSAGIRASTPLSITIQPTTLTITTAATLPVATLGASYSQSLTASGGIPPYQFGLISGTLPAGVTIGSAGVLSGTPATAGTFTFTVGVLDTPGTTGFGLHTANTTFTLVVSATPVSITSGSPLPAGLTGTPYLQTLAASGGRGPYTFALASGTLPPGLTLASSGVVSGTPSAPGTFNFTAQVTDSQSQSATKALSITIASSLGISTDSNLPPGSVAVPYSQTLTATGGTAPYTFALAGCCLPTGLGISSGGVISGSPTPSGTYNFTVSVADSASGSVSKPFSLVINPSPITIATPALLPTATVGVSYSAAFTATGGTGTGLTFTTSSGSAPPGLSFDAMSLSGTPTTAGSYTFTLTFSDSGAAPASRAFTLTVNPAGLAITTGSTLPGAIVGTAYSQKLAATAGTPPYTFMVASGALPGGLTLGPDGTLSGTPTVAGAFNFGIQATDSAAKTATQTFTLSVGASALTITTAALPGGRVGAAYSQAITASGGTAPYIFSAVSGTLPAGLTLSNAGVLSGAPTTPGNFGFTLQVSDSAGLVTAQSFSVAIGPAGLTISTPSPLPSGATGSPYSQTLTVAGGTSPYTFTLMSGTLPAGLTLSTAGTLTGTPTAAGTFAFTVQVTDSAAQSAAMAYSLTITGSTLSIPILSPLLGGSVGIAYSQAVTAAGGTAPYSYSLAAGSLPPGLVLSGAGFITGTPTSAGTFTFAVQATDSTGATVSKIFNITIATIAAPNVPVILAVVNAASYAPGVLAPGEIVTIFGTGLGPATIATAQSSTPGFLDTALANTRVLFNDVAAPLIYTSEKQVSAIVPYGVAGVPGVKTVVEYRGVQSQPITFAPVDSAPGLFSTDASGRGPGAILNQDYSLNSTSNAAAAGSVVMLYATGEGATDPAGVDGKVTTNILAQPKLSVTATIGGLPAEVLYAGGAPGIVAGGLQINLRVPMGLTLPRVEVVITVGTKSSQAGVTLAVK